MLGFHKQMDNRIKLLDEILSFRMQGVEFDNGDMYVDGHKAASDVRDEFVSVTEKLMDELAQCYNVFFFQAEDGIRDLTVTGVQTCALPICGSRPDRTRPHGSPRAAARGARRASAGPGRPRPRAASRCCDRGTRTVICAVVCCPRSEERRVGKEGRSRCAPEQ